MFVFCSMKLESRIGKAMGYWHWRGGEGASPSEFCVSGQLKNIAMHIVITFMLWSIQGMKVAEKAEEGSRKFNSIVSLFMQTNFEGMSSG